MKDRMLSGIKPTGQLHLGSYIGALRQFVNFQDDFEMVAFIANLHCITVPQDPQTLQKNLRDCVALYLACGLDPKKSIIFLQTDVKEHAQLGYIMCCHTYMGELNRMTQFKDKAAKGEASLSGGLYTYPCLMAADILLYDPKYVPVGDDQDQHVELCRDVAARMNNRYGQELFRLPEAYNPKVGARIMSLQDPLHKMSKSDGINRGCIYLLDPLDEARKKIMTAITDSIGHVHYDPENQPGVSNLMTIMSALSGQSLADIEKDYEGKGYGEFKKGVADVVCDQLNTIQQAYQKVISSDILRDVLEDGARRASAIAGPKLDLVQRAIGMEILDR